MRIRAALALNLRNPQDRAGLSGQGGGCRRFVYRGEFGYRTARGACPFSRPMDPGWRRVSTATWFIMILARYARECDRGADLFHGHTSRMFPDCEPVVIIPASPRGVVLINELLVSNGRLRLLSRFRSSRRTIGRNVLDPDGKDAKAMDGFSCAKATYELSPEPAKS